MADTLTQLIAKVQAQLLDGGTLFTTVTCTAAIRQALRELNRSAPLHAAVTIPAVDDQKEYELSDEDAAAATITDVLLQGGNDDAESLRFAAYVEDDRWFFRLQAPQPSSETLIVQYTKPHTVSGLDGATDSSLPPELNDALITGAVAWACYTRAAGTIESNNLEGNVPGNWMKVGNAWHAMFVSALERAQRAPAATGDTAPAAWNDSYHSDEYPW